MHEQPAPVLILAPSERDAAVAIAILGEVGVSSTVCPDLDALVSGLDCAGGAIVTEGALRNSDRKALAAWIRQQPPWSDFPFVLLTSRGGSADAGLTDLPGQRDGAGASLPSLRSRQCRAMRHPGPTAP